MEKPKFIKEIEKFEGKERAKCGKWFIRVYGKLDNKPMVELESLQILIKELHKLEEENRKLKEENNRLKQNAMEDMRVQTKLEQENKNLKLTLEQMENTCKDYLNDRDTLREDNRKLKENSLLGQATMEESYNRITELEKENKNLKDRIRELELCNLNIQTWIDNKEKVNKSMRDEIRNLKKELGKITVHSNMLESENILLKKECKARLEKIEELEKILEHRDSFFSIMRDILANEDIDNTELAAILYCVVHKECGDIDLSKKELEIVNNFWRRKYC